MFYITQRIHFCFCLSSASAVSQHLFFLHEVLWSEIEYSTVFEHAADDAAVVKLISRLTLTSRIRYTVMECMPFSFSQARAVRPQFCGPDVWVLECAASNINLPPYQTTSLLRPSPSPAKVHGTAFLRRKRAVRHGPTAIRLAVRAAAAASSFPSPVPDPLSTQLQQTLDVAKWLSSTAKTDGTSKSDSVGEGSCAEANALAQAFATQLSTEGRAALLAALYPTGKHCARSQTVI